MVDSLGDEHIGVKFYGIAGSLGRGTGFPPPGRPDDTDPVHVGDISDLMIPQHIVDGFLNLV